MDIKQTRPKKKSISDKIKHIFTGMCTPIHPTIIDKASQNSPHSKKQNRSKSKTKKQTIVRQIFNLNDAFIKQSRKNIIEEQFVAEKLTNYQVQYHIKTRIDKTQTALCQMELSRETLKNIMHSIIVTEGDSQPAVQTKDHIRIIDPIAAFRPGTIDLLLYQTKFSKDMKKVKAKKNFLLSFAASPEIQEIEKILESTQIPNILFLCSSLISEEELRDLLKQYCNRYLFELERVRMNQNIFCYIVYASKDINFLRINKEAFKDFIIEELGVSNKKKTYKERFQTNQNKYEILEKMITCLIDNNLSFQTILTLKTIKKCYLNKNQSQQTYFTNNNFKSDKILVEDFIKKMREEFPVSDKILEEYAAILIGAEMQLTTDINWKLVQETPKFDPLGEEIETGRFEKID